MISGPIEDDKKYYARKNSIAKLDKFLIDGDEEVYLGSKRDSSGRFSLDWLELENISMNPSLLRRYLLKFKSLDRRRLAVSRKEVIGFTHTDLYELYGIHKDAVGKFTGVKEDTVSRSKFKPVIRDVLEGANGANRKLFAFISVLARIPYSWLEDVKPSLCWETRHFHYLNDIIVDEDELISIIQSLGSISFDIRPLILLTRANEYIYIRLVSRNESFMLEIFNIDSPLWVILKIRKLLGSFIVETGIIKTVIPHQVNYALLSPDWDRQYSPEFIREDF